MHSNAFGGAAMTLAGGRLLLSSPGGDYAYDKAIAVVSNSTLAAGQVTS